MTAAPPRLDASPTGAWHVDIAYYRMSEGFTEAYAVTSSGCTVVAGRRQKEPFVAGLLSTEVAGMLLNKPRATASITGHCYEMGDFVVRVGTFKAANHRSRVVAVRYAALRPSHAAKVEKDFIKDVLGVTGVTHDPLPLAKPDFDLLGPYLNLVVCFRHSLYGT